MRVRARGRTRDVEVKPSNEVAVNDAFEDEEELELIAQPPKARPAPTKRPAPSEPAPVANGALADDEDDPPPFDAPDEEELELLMSAPAAESARPMLVLNDPLPAADEEEDVPPFDAPDAEDLRAMHRAPDEDEAFVEEDDGVGEAEDTELDAGEAAGADFEEEGDESRFEAPYEEFLDDDEAPFDAPDDIEECFGAMHVAASRELPLIELTEVLPPAPARPREARSFNPAVTQAELAAPPVPPIVIHASWDRVESGEAFAAFAADKRLARAEIGIGRGGLDGAAAELESGAKPDLVIVDTNLSGAEMLTGVSALMQRAGAGVKVIVIGAVNDIGALRAMQSRGVAAYIMAPVSAETLARTTCELFAETDRARVIAVMGARGGVGSSTLAQNLAWTIADKLDAPTALVDLDVGFGAAASVFKLDAKGFVTDLMGDGADDATLDRSLTQAHDRLLVAAAPNSPTLAVGLAPEAVEAMLARVRRTSAFVVLDLPHVWTAWMRQALVAADDIVLVAGPDLASLRNTDNLVKLLRNEREGKPEPVLTLSMTGVPKRPEISAKEFASSVNVEPITAFAFDPELYGEAETAGRLLVEAAPKSKPAQAIEHLAMALTGRVVTERKPKPRRDTPAPKAEVKEQPAGAAPAQLAAEAPSPALELEKNDEAPAEPKPLPQPKQPEPQQASPAVVKEVPPARKIVLPEPANESDHDELSAFERAYIEKARRKAMSELDARRAKRSRRRGGSRTMVRFLGVTAASSALMLVTIWSIRENARPAEAPAAAPAQAVALPATPVDPAAALARDYDEALAFLAANDARGLALLRETAEAGFVMAQYRLAKVYEAGEGVELDPIAARQWTERAAAGGNVRAMHDLGFYFARGDAAPLDEAAAFRWFRQAAEFGVADSQYNLGVLYEQGRGVRVDTAEALFWFTLAANQGDIAAVERVTQLQGDLTMMQIEQARARADSFTPREANPAANGE